LVFSPDGTLLASASRLSGAKLWDVQTRRERLTLQGPPFAMLSAAFSPDGKVLAAGGYDRKGYVHLWDTHTGQELALLAARPNSFGTVTGVCFSADGNLLATVSEDGVIRLWKSERER